MKRSLLLIVMLALVSGFLFADREHQLKQGETLYSLSRSYSVTVQEIMNANSITDPSSLRVGSLLIIPGR